MNYIRTFTARKVVKTQQVGCWVNGAFKAERIAPMFLFLCFIRGIHQLIQPICVEATNGRNVSRMGVFLRKQRGIRITESSTAGNYVGLLNTSDCWNDGIPMDDFSFQVG